MFTRRRTQRRVARHPARALERNQPQQPHREPGAEAGKPKNPDGKKEADEQDNPPGIQGQGKPLHFGDSSNVHENKHTEQPEVESIFVSIGDTVNLTCNIAIPEVDWHFKDTNLTTTILSYGVQLLVNQAIIYTAMDSNIINDENFQDIQYPSSNDEILKYRLSSDMHFKHQLTLYIESSKDEGSYQCVDSKSETPVKKTIHVILSKTTLYIAKK